MPPVQLHSTEHRGEIKLCQKCGRTNTTEFPDNVSQPVQYGPRIRGFTVYLHDYHLSLIIAVVNYYLMLMGVK